MPWDENMNKVLSFLCYNYFLIDFLYFFLCAIPYSYPIKMHWNLTICTTSLDGALCINTLTTTKLINNSAPCQTCKNIKDIQVSSLQDILFQHAASDGDTLLMWWTFLLLVNHKSDISSLLLMPSYVVPWKQKVKSFAKKYCTFT